MRFYENNKSPKRIEFEFRLAVNLTQTSYFLKIIVEVLIMIFVFVMLPNVFLIERGFKNFLEKKKMNKKIINKPNNIKTVLSKKKTDKEAGKFPVHYYYYAAGLFVVIGVIFYIVSLFSGNTIPLHKKKRKRNQILLFSSFFHLHKNNKKTKRIQMNFYLRVLWIVFIEIIQTSQGLQ